MSKYVKDLLTKDLAGRLDGVEECIVADVIGMNANSTSDLRKRLRTKGCLLYTSPSPRDQRGARMPSSA